MNIIIIVAAAFTGIFFTAVGCPEGNVADDFLVHFMEEYPKGVPGINVEDPMPLHDSLQFGPATIVNMEVLGLGEMITHNFSINAHKFNGFLFVSFPYLGLRGTLQLPGLFWTIERNFSVIITDLEMETFGDIVVLNDSCFYIADYKSNITKSNVTYSTDGLLDGSSMFDVFFSEITELMMNITKPTILDSLNNELRRRLTNFLPPSTSRDMNAFGYTQPPVIPTPEEQKEALVRFVRFQIPWMFGDPLELTGVSLNILSIAELHNMSVHNLERVTEVQHLSFEFDGENFNITTRMLHENVFNRHRVLWFPGAIFRTSQWTDLSNDLIKHKAVLILNRRMTSPPAFSEFSVRPVVFNPHSRTAFVRKLSSWSRRLMDAMRTRFGDSIQALFYAPMLQRANTILSTVDTRQLVRDFVCYAAGEVVIPEQ